MLTISSRQIAVIAIALHVFSSFSSPMLSGMVACLWQAFPEKSNYEVMEAVRQAGDRNISFNGKVIIQPDTNDGYGFGITDFLRAYNILKYGENDVMIHNYSQENAMPTSNIFGFTLSQQDYSNLQVNATPLAFVNGKVIEGKAKKVKVRQIITENGQQGHVVVLPKLPKSKPYQLYRLDFLFGDKSVSRVVGMEQTVLP